MRKEVIKHEGDLQPGMFYILFIHTHVYKLCIIQCMMTYQLFLFLLSFVPGNGHTFSPCAVLSPFDSIEIKYSCAFLVTGAV